MMPSKRVAVFCAASEEIDPLYADAAMEVGHMLGRLGATLVYGGARFGLMEATAKGAKEVCAHVELQKCFTRLFVESDVFAAFCAEA